MHAFCTTTTASAEDNLSYRRRRKIWLHRRYLFVIWLLGASYHCSRAQILVRRSFVANLKSQVGRFEFNCGSEIWMGSLRGFANQMYAHIRYQFVVGSPRGLANLMYALLRFAVLHVKLSLLFHRCPVIPCTCMHEWCRLCHELVCVV